MALIVSASLPHTVLGSAGNTCRRS
jgi:hypothetical protein